MMMIPSSLTPVSPCRTKTIQPMRLLAAKSDSEKDGNKISYESQSHKPEIPATMFCFLDF